MERPGVGYKSRDEISFMMTGISYMKLYSRIRQGQQMLSLGGIIGDVTCQEH